MDESIEIVAFPNLEIDEMYSFSDVCNSKFSFLVIEKLDNLGFRVQFTDKKYGFLSNDLNLTLYKSKNLRLIKELF